MFVSCGPLTMVRKSSLKIGTHVLLDNMTPSGNGGAALVLDGIMHFHETLAAEQLRFLGFSRAAKSGRRSFCLFLSAIARTLSLRKAGKGCLKERAIAAYKSNPPEKHVARPL